MVHRTAYASVASKVKVLIRGKFEEKWERRLNLGGGCQAVYGLGAAHGAQGHMGDVQEDHGVPMAAPDHFVQKAQVRRLWHAKFTSAHAGEGCSSGLQLFGI